MKTKIFLAGGIALLVAIHCAIAGTTPQHELRLIKSYGQVAGTIHGNVLTYIKNGRKYSIRIKGLLPSADTHVLDLAVQKDTTLYIPIIHRVASNPTNPSGRCGAGTEDWLLIAKLEKGQSAIVGKKLVNSCLGIFSLANEELDNPYKGITWNSALTAYQIEWLSPDRTDGRFSYLHYSHGRFK